MATMEEKTSLGEETDSPRAAAAASSAGMPAMSPGSPVPGDASSGRADPRAVPEKWPQYVAPVRRPEAPEKLFHSPYPTDKIPEGATSKAEYAEKKFCGNHGRDWKESVARSCS